MSNKINFLKTDTELVKNITQPYHSTIVTGMSKGSELTLNSYIPEKKEQPNAFDMYDKMDLVESLYTPFESYISNRDFNTFLKRRHRVRYEFDTNSMWNYHGLWEPEFGHNLYALNKEIPIKSRVRPFKGESIKIVEINETDNKIMLPQLYSTDTDKVNIIAGKYSAPNSKIVKINKILI